MQDDRYRFPNGNPRHDALLSAFNAKVGVVDSIRAKSITDIKQYFDKFALQASSDQFMLNAEGSTISETPSRDSPSASAVAIATVVPGGSRSNKGEALRCRCGLFQQGHIVFKYRQDGECTCPQNPGDCKAKWVRNGYICPKEKHALQMDRKVKERQSIHRRAREAFRRQRHKRPKSE